MAGGDRDAVARVELVIAQSVMQLFASRDETRDWARAIVAMRHEFGGHPYGKDPGIARERRESRAIE